VSLLPDATHPEKRKKMAGFFRSAVSPLLVLERGGERGLTANGGQERGGGKKRKANIFSNKQDHFPRPPQKKKKKKGGFALLSPRKKGLSAIAPAKPPNPLKRKRRGKLETLFSFGWKRGGGKEGFFPS